MVQTVLHFYTWQDLHGLGTYCLSVIHYLVLTPPQTQRCQYCFYNAPSSQGLILYFTVGERRKKTSLPASERVMFLSHTNSPLSRSAIYLSHSHEGCCSPSLRQSTEHSSLGGQAYVDVVLVMHNHLRMTQGSGYGMSRMAVVGKRGWHSSLLWNISLVT